MPSLFFADLNDATPSVLSPELTLLQQAGREKLTIAPTFVMHPSSFVKIADENALFSDELSEAKLLKKIASVKLPKQLVSELHHLCQQLTKRGYLRIKAWTQFGETPWISEIKGDSNAAESLVSAWQSAIELNLSHGTSLVQAVTNCHLVLQGQVASPVACGEIFSRHPETGEKHLVVIRLWPGSPHAALAQDTPTTYAIDVRTGTIVQRQLGSSKQKATRRSDGVVLSQSPEAAEFDSDAEIRDLVRDINVFKRKYPYHVRAFFEVDDTTLVVRSMSIIDDHEEFAVRAPQLITKVYVSTGSRDSLDISAHDNCDGIGLLRGEYVFDRLETHPMELIKRGRQEMIADHLSTFLKEANQGYPDRRIIYRLQNFTSQELLAMNRGEAQEKQEPNPYLGWRGGLRLMEQPQLFEPELATFGSWLKRRHAPSGLIVPFVRSAAEWRWIVNRWKEREFFANSSFENWFQITTPENITNLESYMLPEVHGLSLNLRTVTALMTGIDPDDAQLQASYPPPIELQQQVLEEVGQRVAVLREQSARGKLLLHLHLEDYNNALVSSAVNLRYDGIIVHPAAIGVLRGAIGSTERDLLFESH